MQRTSHGFHQSTNGHAKYQLRFLSKYEWKIQWVRLGFDEHMKNTKKGKADVLNKMRMAIKGTLTLLANPPGNKITS